ncbi:Uncharacterized protein DBV15_10072 [Temnothorax longispinosus]|uniref:Myb/SANT-like DNA-binding domain-containing protein n=1 Tax=Temnothorax longispinosus TaxID=300112 RepID=A0A4S2L216_9HYME|nr:Uncharacterized protein DBV15_10072 [Temnothorax longispinosus]
MAENVTLDVLVGEKEELYKITVSHEEHEEILKGNEALLLEIVAKETEKRSVATIQTLLAKKANSTQDLNLETTKSMESDNTEEEEYKDKLYRERENDFITGLKRHNKIWSEIASELKKLNYNVSGVQAQNKMSSLKRTYKKIKDSNAKSGNHNSSWAFYSIMDSLFGDKSWVSPPAIASSDGPAVPNTLSFFIIICVIILNMSLITIFCRQF